MDNGSAQDEKSAESDPLHSETNAGAEENGAAPVVGSTEIAIQELRRIREQINSHLDKINTESMKQVSDPIQDASNSSMPTDLTTTEGSQTQSGDGVSIAVIFKGNKRTGEEHVSSQNMITEMRRKHDRATDVGTGAIKGLAGCGIKSTDTEAERFEKMKATFDIIPTPKPSLAQIQKEYTENRIQSHKKICELNAEVTVKAKESEFLELQLARSHTDLRAAKSEIATKEDENRKLRQEITELESKSSRRILELTLELQQKAAKLETYERLYSQMDHIASVESVDSGDMKAASKMSATFPGSFQYKLQQSMDLAQRLKEERDHLERSRDESDRKLKEIETKNQSYLIEMNKLKMGEDMKLTNAKASLQLKCFELERVNLVLLEYQQKYRTAMNDNDNLRKKLEMLNEELNNARCELNEEITRLSLELQSKSSRLELYEKIEDALDEMILKAATVPNADVGNDLLSFCSGGPSLPTDSRRRLQQAFDLAKKNCELEKTVADQKQEILNLYDERQTLREEVQTVKSLSGFSVGKLVETITEKNREIGKLNSRIGGMERDLSEMRQSKEVLQQTVDSLKTYQDQVLTLFHSGARVSQSKVDRQPSDKEITSGASVASLINNNVVSSKTSMHLHHGRRPSRIDVPPEGSTAPQSTVSATNSEGKKEPVSLKYGDSSALPSPADSTYTFPATNSRLLLEPYDHLDTELRTILEESDEEIIQADSVIMESTSSSVTSSMFGPPPRVIRRGTPYIVSVRKIPSKSSSSSTTSKQQQLARSKPIPGRKVISSDLIGVRSDDTTKQVALRLSKVKPSASTFF